MQAPDGTVAVPLAADELGRKDSLMELFTYHAPTEEQRNAYVTIREGALNLARIIDGCCPPGPDRTAAIRKIREAVMTANASIATDNAQYR